MGKIVFFKQYKCNKCGAYLPVETHYKNNGMVRTFCVRCGKCIHINKQEIVPDKR